MNGKYKIYAIAPSGCKQTIAKLRNATYLFKAKEVLPHQVKLDVDKYGGLRCPKDGEHVLLFKFTEKEIAQLFQTYISDVKKIIYDRSLDMNALHPIEAIPSHIQSRDEKDLSALNAYAEHPYLKFLGVSINDPDFAKMFADETISYGDKKRTFYMKHYDKQKGVFFGLEKNYGIVSTVFFVTRRKEGSKQKKKIKPFKGHLPEGVNGVMVENTYDSPFYFKVYELDKRLLKILGKRAYGTDLDKALAERKKSRENYLISSKADLKRFADPKGKDIWQLVGQHDDLFVKYCFNKTVRRYSYTKRKWNDRKEIPLSNSNFNILDQVFGVAYIIKKGATRKKEYLQERLPFDLENVQFDLSTFLPQIFALPEFAKARYGDETKKGIKKPETYTVIELKFKTNYGERFIIIKKYQKDPGSTFSSMTFSSHKHSGYINTVLRPLTPGNNPWKIHNETIVKVDEEAKSRYISSISRLLGQMEQNFETLKLDPQKFESNASRDISFIAEAIIPEAEVSLLVDLKSGGDYVQLNLPEKIKEELLITLINKKYIGSYSLTPGGLENENLFGKCLLIRKNNKIVGVLMYKWHQDMTWIFRLYPFDEEQFKTDIIKIIRQGIQDDYQSWLKEKKYSTYTLYKSHLSIIDSKDGHEFISAYERFPRYVLEKALEGYTKGKRLATGIQVLESFADYEKGNRYVKLSTSKGIFLVLLSTKDRKVSLHISHGRSEGYDLFVQENFEPMTVARSFDLLVESMLNAETNDMEKVWSTRDQKNFSESYQSGNKREVYSLILVYEAKHGRPSASITITHRGKSKVIYAKEENDIPLNEGFRGVLCKVAIPEEVEQFKFSGGYYEVIHSGRVYAVLFKEKN